MRPGKRLLPAIRREAVSTASLLLERALRLLVWFLVGTAVIRALGPEGQGVLAYGQGLAGMLMALVSLGLDAVVTKDLVARPEARATILGTSLAMRALGGLSLVGLVTLGLRFDALSNDSATVTLLCAAAAAGQFSYCIEWYFQSKTAGHIYLLTSVFALLVTSALRLHAIDAQLDVRWFAAINVVDTLCFGLGYLFAYRWIDGNRLRFFVDLSLARRYLSASAPMILSGLAVMGLIRMDQLVIAHFHGSAALGQYSTAVQLVEVSTALPTILVTVFFPRLVRSHGTDSSSYSLELRRTYRRCVGAAIVIAIVLSVWSEQLCRMAFGMAYSETPRLLSICAWTAVFGAVGLVLQRDLIIRSKQHYMPIFYSIALAVSVTLNVVFVPRFGSVATAALSVLSSATAFLFVPLIFRATRQSVMTMFSSVRLAGRTG